jgi:transcriptional regulator with XRE-family HTH domain
LSKLDFDRAFGTLISGFGKIRMSFGKIISEARKKLGMSQKGLAQRIKKENGESISPQYLNDIEHDRRNPPSESLITQFARELGLPEKYLILAAGAVPGDMKEKVATSRPEAVEAAFQAFRRKIRKRG